MAKTTQIYNMNDVRTNLPPNIAISERDPIASDTNYTLGTPWINTATGGLWVMGSSEASWGQSGRQWGTAPTVTSTAADATVAISAYRGIAIFNGFTTASGAEEIFIIEDVACNPTSAILITSETFGAAAARMQVTQVIPGNKVFNVVCRNRGAAGLNGDVHLNFWILS